MNDPQSQPTNHQRLLEKAMAHSTHAKGAIGQPATPTLAELAKHFPDYEIVELIGRGGMGAVYQAVQVQLQRTVAIKVLPKELAGDPEFGERFLREAQTLATLNHPGIITVYDYGERDGVFFLVTEFVDGVNLRQLMELGELSPAEALRIAPQLCTALQFAHEHGVVHRDIKPENILVDTNGQVKVADFGLAKVARPGDAVELTRNTAVLGTPHYMAPEQWHGAQKVDHRADIYSLGVVLYEMLTGNLPLGNFDMPSERGGVPQGLDAVVRRALAQQPKNRYQHARDVQSDVEQQAQRLSEQPAHHDHVGGASSQRAADSSRRPSTLVKGPFVAIAAILLAAATLLALVALRQSEWGRHYRFEAARKAYRASAEQAIALAQNGQAIRDVMALPPMPPAPIVPIDALPVMAVSLIGGTLLLLAACGFGAIRTIRNSKGKKRGLGFAVFTAWIVPLSGAGAIACAPLAAIRSNDLQVMFGIALIGGLIYGAVRFLMWETARQRALVAAGIGSHHGKAWITIAATIALCAIGNAIASPRYMPGKIRHVISNVGPMFPEDLIGRGTDEVIDLLGPPIDISIDSKGATWSYKNERGKTVPNAVRIEGDRVTRIDRQSKVFQANRSGQQPRISNAISTWTERHGQPIKVQQVGNTTHYHFANGHVVTEADGIVIKVTAPGVKSPPASPVPSEKLLGQTREDVMQLLGPPLAISFSQATENWCYQNDNGSRVEEALVFAGDQVVSAHADSSAFLPNPANMSDPQLGQLMTEFVKVLGSPSSRTDSQLASTFTFDNGLEVTVRNGRVVGIRGK